MIKKKKFFIYGIVIKIKEIISFYIKNNYDFKN